MPPDPKHRFTITRENYAKYRPSYPAELVDWILATGNIAHGARVADIGCGTGISTRLFSARGFDVIGIDPNESMLEQARALPGGRYQTGESSATGLESRSVALIIAAQAFHWFAVVETIAEFQRILLPGGWCAAFWNVRDHSPFMDEYESLLGGLRAYRETPRPWAVLDEIAACPSVHGFTGREFEHAQALDWASLLGRMNSNSYVAHETEGREAFFAGLRRAFERHAVGGSVAFLYRAVVRMWQL